MKFFKKLLRKGLWLSFGLFCLLFLGIVAAYTYVEIALPRVNTLKTVQFQVPLRIYSSDNQLIAEYGEKRRMPANLKDIPKDLIHAVLATEDQRYYEHPGVDIFGLMRAAVKLISTGSISQGGSTITMQVARNFFLSSKKTFLRKFNEILLAIKIDHTLSKEKILELYLNKIYLGNRAYGVASAAQVYYGKSLSELNLAQFAMIAGLPKAPSSLNPLANPIAAIDRRNHVLSRMLEQNYIDKDAYLEATQMPVSASYHKTKIHLHAPYVAEMVRAAMVERFAKDAYIKGYRVYTTIDSALQRKANEALEKHLLAYDKRHGYRGIISHMKFSDTQLLSDKMNYLAHIPNINQLTPALITNVEEQSVHAITKEADTILIPWKGLSWARRHLGDNLFGASPKTAHDILHVGDVVYVFEDKQSTWHLSQIPQIEGALVSMKPNDGAINAIVGGFNFVKSNYNRATQAARQPGSSFKPFIYAAALSKGYSLATLINDAPIVMDDPSLEGLWRPQNDTHEFYGPTRLKIGLVRSRNLVSIRILELISVPYAIEFLSRFGFDPNSLPKSLSLALGSLEITPLELTTAYASLANGGYLIEPYIIQRITDDNNTTLLEAEPQIACYLCTEDSEELQQIPEEQRAKQIISPQVAYLMNIALQDVIQSGTGRAARQLGRHDLAGKTGTTNEQIDAWFAGFNHDLVTTVWIGFDAPQSLHEYAAKAALPTWMDFMKFALSGKPESSLTEPPNLVTVRIDPQTGLLARNSQKDAIFETFRKNNAPQEQSLMDTAKESEIFDDAKEAVEKEVEHIF